MQPARPAARPTKVKRLALLPLVLVLAACTGQTSEAPTPAEASPQADVSGSSAECAMVGGCPTAPARPQVLYPGTAPGAVQWTGAEVCIVKGSTSCRTVSAETARDLDAVVSAAEPAAPQGYCDAGGPVYRITLMHPSAEPAEIVVPQVCQPMTRGGKQYILGPDGLAAVQRAARKGSVDPRECERLDDEIDDSKLIGWDPKADHPACPS